jgi:hypothetical protein
MPAQPAQMRLCRVAHTTQRTCIPSRELWFLSFNVLPWPTPGLAKEPCFKPGSHFPRNLVPNLTQYGGEHRKEGLKQ